MPQVDKKDSGKMGFSSSLKGGTANGLGKPLPPNEWMLVELSHAGPFGTLRWLEFWPLFKSHSDGFHRPCLT